MPSANRITVILTSALCLLLLNNCKPAQTAKGPAAMPIVPVSAAKATQESVPTELRVVGTVEASAIVQIKSQISGQLLTRQLHRRPECLRGRPAVRDRSASLRRGPPPGRSQRHARPGADRAVGSRSRARRRPGQIQPERRRSLRRTRQGRCGRRSQADQAKTSADVARESARATQAAIESAKAALDSDLSAVGHGQTEPELLPDPLAARRTHRQPAGPRGQPGEGQRRSAGGDPPGLADLRQLQRARTAPGRGPPPQRQPPARRARVRPGRRRRDAAPARSR